MKTKFTRVSTMFVSVVLLAGCVSTKETTSTTFLAMATSCVATNLLGPAGAIVFFGPNDYRPGDLFERSGLPNGKWSYDPRYQYTKQVEAKTVEDVVKAGTVPAECLIGQDRSYDFSADLSGNAIITAAAVPLSASAGLALKGGKVQSVKVSKLYIDTLPFFEPYSDSLRALPGGAPARLAVQNGGYFVATAVLIAEGYSVDVKYGPEFDAKAAAQASLPANDKGNLTANVNVTLKDAQTLTFTVAGRTALALVARPIAEDFKVQSAQPAGAPVSAPQYGNLVSRGWASGQ